MIIDLRDVDTRNRGVILVLIYYCHDPNPLDTVSPPIEKLIGYNRHIDYPIKFSETYNFTISPRG